MKKLALVGLSLWVALPVLLYLGETAEAGKNRRLRALEEQLSLLIETNNRNVAVINQNFAVLDERLSVVEEILQIGGVAIRRPIEPCDQVLCQEEIHP